MGGMSRRHKKRNDEADWRWRHARKRVYGSRHEAWLAVLRLWIRQRHWDSLQPYECRWGEVHELRKSYPLHYHIGHGPRGLPTRIRYRLRYMIVYPWRRLKSSARYKLRARDIRARRPPHIPRKAGRQEGEKK